MEKSTKNIAVLDIETGGFSRTKNAICEIGVLILNVQLEVIEEYRTLISPYIRNPLLSDFDGQLCSYKDDAMEINGIQMEDILKAPSAEVVAKEFVELFTNHNIYKCIGHNIDGFDKPWIEEFLQRFEVPFEFPETIDTMKMSKKSGEKKNSLKELCEKLGIENKNAHTAIGDCYATLELYIGLK